MTKFIESFATQQLLPPWNATGALTWSFVVRMPRPCIQRYLDAYFNGCYPDRAPFHYTALPGKDQFALLSAVYFPKVASRNPQTASRLGRGRRKYRKLTDWDHLKHNEVYLSFPVLRHGVTADNLLTDPVLVWVEPFIFSDNDSVVFSSREIWGSDMYLAEITRADGADLHLDLGMIGIKEFNPRSMSELLAVLHLKTGGSSDLTIAQILDRKPELKTFASILGGSGALAGVLPEGVRKSPYPGGVELNNLKQFRDCYDMGAAIYRAIVASKATHTNVRVIEVFDAEKCEIDFMWSDSVGELLTSLFGVESWTVAGPPADHFAAAQRGPVTPKGPAFIPPEEHFKEPPPTTPNEMDWDMNRVALKAEFAFSFSSNVLFEVVDTIHTYGLAPPCRDQAAARPRTSDLKS